jgi:hypothetical protein
MTTLSPHALIVPTDIAEAAVGGMETEVTSLGEGILASVINTVSREVEEEVGRRLHVHADTLHIQASDWEESPRDGYAALLWLPLWPLVEVTTSGVTVAAGTAYPGGQIVYANERYTELAGFFGYRREDQTLATLQAITGLSALTVLPEAMDGLVHDVACELALHMIDVRAAGRYSGGRKIQQVGSVPMTIEAPDPLRRTRILQRLHSWRPLAV